MVRNVEPQAKTVELTPPSNMNLQSIAPLEQAIEGALGHKPDVIMIKMNELVSIDSVGLNWLLAMQTQLAGLGIVLAIKNPNPLVHDILTATRLDHRFKIEHPEESIAGGRHA